MDGGLLGSLRKMPVGRMEAFLDVELARLPIRPRARTTLRVLILMATEYLAWRGRLAEIADAVAAYTREGVSSRETAKRSIRELRERGLVQVAQDAGVSSTYEIQWPAILSLRDPSLLQESRTRPGQSPGPHNPGQPGPTQVTLTRVNPGQPLTRVSTTIPTIREGDPGQSDPGHHPADAVAVLEISKAAPAQTALKRAPARRPLWGRTIDPKEWRDPEELIPELFDCVVAAGLAVECEDDRQCFAALVFHVRERRSAKNHMALLTTILLAEGGDRFGNRPWRDLPNNSQREAARHLLLKIDGRVATRRDAYIEQLQERNDGAKREAKEKADQVKRLKEWEAQQCRS
jgi:hypothetical protein